MFKNIIKKGALLGLICMFVSSAAVADSTVGNGSVGGVSSITPANGNIVLTGPASTPTIGLPTLGNSLGVCTNGSGILTTSGCPTSGAAMSAANTGYFWATTAACSAGTVEPSGGFIGALSSTTGCTAAGGPKGRIAFGDASSNNASIRWQPNEFDFIDSAGNGGAAVNYFFSGNGAGSRMQVNNSFMFNRNIGSSTLGVSSAVCTDASSFLTTSGCVVGGATDPIDFTYTDFRPNTVHEFIGSVVNASGPPPGAGKTMQIRADATAAGGSTTCIEMKPESSAANFGGNVYISNQGCYTGSTPPTRGSVIFLQSNGGTGIYLGSVDAMTVDTPQVNNGNVPACFQSGRIIKGNLTTCPGTAFSTGGTATANPLPVIGTVVASLSADCAAGAMCTFTQTTYSFSGSEHYTANPFCVSQSAYTVGTRLMVVSASYNANTFQVNQIKNDDTAGLLANGTAITVTFRCDGGTHG